MKCEECGGTGLTDNHVTGEVCCSACDGTCIEPGEALSERREPMPEQAPKIESFNGKGRLVYDKKRRTIVSQGQWQPIETAPKDGTDIIVYRPKFDGDYIPQVGVDWWSERLGGVWAKSRKDIPPTHWQPLPAPPAP